MHQTANITAVGMMNMPKGRGQKGGVPKCKRVRGRAGSSEPNVVVSKTFTCSLEQYVYG